MTEKILFPWVTANEFMNDEFRQSVTADALSQLPGSLPN